MDTQDVGSFTVSAGIHRGSEHLYVTHRETGRQWVSKDTLKNTTSTVSSTVGLIEIGALRFDPRKTVASCDTRFWIQAMPTSRSEFDALCFLGD